MEEWKGRDLFGDLDGYLVNRIMDHLPPCSQQKLACLSRRLHLSARRRRPMPVEHMELAGSSLLVTCGLEGCSQSHKHRSRDPLQLLLEPAQHHQPYYQLGLEKWQA